MTFAGCLQAPCHAASCKMASREVPLSLDALVAQAKQKSTIEVPEAVAAILRSVVAHNDAHRRNERVTAADVMKLLADEHGLVMGRPRFDKLVKQVCGRGFGS